MNYSVIARSLLALVVTLSISKVVVADNANELANSISSSLEKVESSLNNEVINATNYSNDAMITANVKSAFINNKLDFTNKISVSTKEGVVELTGSVPSEEIKKNAVTIASKVEGVKEVHDNLNVKEANSNDENYLTDTVITSKVKAALLTHDKTPFTGISVKTVDGVVYLTGTVKSKEQSILAEHVAKNTKHVKGVKNQLIVE